ncbi:MAG: hypothetical protein OXI91_00555 [Chloroflexota bacterium]|nr:hypothetical protein [Chloroflexota bacterium]
MPKRDYERGEAYKLGRAIYVKHIKPQMTEKDIGNFVAIDVDSGDYEMDVRFADALVRLRIRRPQAVTYAQRIGYLTPFSFVPRKPDDV